MGWRGSVREGTGPSSVSISCKMSLVADACPVDRSAKPPIVYPTPACLSFVALPFSPSPAIQFPVSISDSSPCRFLGFVSPQHNASGPSFNSCCSCALRPPMYSLLPSPFSCASLFFLPAHVPRHRCASSPLSSRVSPVPSSARWRRRKRQLRVVSSDNVLRLSSLASLTSSLPSFSSTEKVFLATGTKDSGKVSSEGSEDDDVGDAEPLVRSLTAGNVRLRHKVASFFLQLPFELQGRAAKRKDFNDEASIHGEEKGVKQEAKRKAIEQTSKHLLAGAVAAMVSRTIVAPLERLKLEYLVRGAKGSVVDTVRAILMTEGVRGFWKGNGVNILRTAPFKSVNFFAYDTYRTHLLRFGDRSEVTNLERLAAGAAAGVTATILCFPLDTIRTMIVAPGGESLGGMIGCFQHLLRTEGCLALYKGLLPAVVSMAPAGAVFYGVYDMLKSAYLSSPQGKEMIRTRLKRAQERPEEVSAQLELGPFRTLLFGALAGACSETVTYPLEVVRRAQQMQYAANKLGMVGTIQSLLNKGGVGALYSGLLPSTLQVLPSAALSYFVYETLKIAFKIP